jgi:hypothetical protein
MSTLTGHSDLWRDFFWSADSRQITSASVDRTIRRWNATDGQCLSTTLRLPDGEVAYFNQGGKLETSSPVAEKHLVYVVEEADGEQRLYTPAEFRALVERNVKKQEAGKGTPEAAPGAGPHPSPLPKGEGTKTSPLPPGGRGAGGEGGRNRVDGPDSPDP